MTPPTELVKILVAEDSPTQAEYLRLFLERQGFVVTLARNGLEALSSIHDSLPTLVLSDVVMPLMDGYELCRAIRHKPAIAHLPVVLLTQLNSTRDILNALECEADNFITKPFSEEYLLSRMRSILAGLQLRRHHPGEQKSTVVFQGELFQITAEPQRILDLLTSTYEASVLKNRELQETQRVLEETNLLLQRSLNERDCLLKEIHHRVKNNLQVISSILNLQALNVRQTSIDDVFRDCRDRIRTMAQVHEQLYRSGNFAAIDLGENLKSIGTQLIKSHARTEIVSRFEIEELFIDIDRAIPCGLAATEMITNAFKHAFIGRDSGLLTISLRRLEPDWAELVVADDGLGLPDHFAIATAESTGMTLIATFAAQIDGTIQVDCCAGTRFSIRFPLSAPPSMAKPAWQSGERP